MLFASAVERLFTSRTLNTHEAISEIRNAPLALSTRVLEQHDALGASVDLKKLTHMPDRENAERATASRSVEELLEESRRLKKEASKLEELAKKLKKEIQARKD
jgi:hypothetical protein